MDLDREMDDAAEADQHETMTHLPQADNLLQPDVPEEPGEVSDDGWDNDESRTVVPTKVHVQGLDALHTADLRAYVKAHLGVVDRVEWIDDSSANLVFSSESTASEAIVALSAVQVADASALAVGETLPAKPFDGRPEVSLQVRFALERDKKQAGAALRSRYYLLHPEHDPEERRRRRQENRSRYRDRDRGGHYRTNGKTRRGSEDGSNRFEATMYDDVPPPSWPSRHSGLEAGPTSPTRENHGKELFTDRVARRGRSASPQRDRHGDAHMDSPDSWSRSNRAHARSIKGRLSVDNSAKELFPSKASGRGGRLDQLERSIGSATLQEEDMPKVVAVPDASAGGEFSIRGSASHARAGRRGFAIKGAATSAPELFTETPAATNAGRELLDRSHTRRRRAEDLFS